MHKRSILFGLFLLLTAVTGCTIFPSSGVESCDGDGLLFSDDFSGERDCGWALYTEGGATVEIADGTLQISTSQQGQFWWTNTGQTFTDVIVVTQARQANGPDDNAYGLICRYQDSENFYIFLISGDGYYAIGKYQTGSVQVQYLTEGNQYIYSDVINQGIATNELRASCVGNELSLAVNGILLATVTDPTFVNGDVGVGVTTFQPGTAVVEFDNFSVLQP